MPDEQETEQQVTTETPEAEPTTETQQEPPKQAAPAAAKDKGAGGKVIPVPTGDFKKIKDEARERGRREALAELDQHAVTAGFTSMADALGALAKLKSAPTTTASPHQTTQEITMPKQETKTPDKTKAAVESTRVAEERVKMRKQWKREERQRRELQRQLDAKEAEMQLHHEMFGFGIKDVDYAHRLLVRELAGKSEEEIAAFNRTAFYEGLRKDKPYLFGEVTAPATTGTTDAAKANGQVPTPPPAGQPTTQAAQQQQFDARTATPAQVQERLKSLGLNPYM